MAEGRRLCASKLSDEEIEGLIAKSREAKEKAYARYSHFRVGAALLTGTGEVFTGCNVENCAYPLCTCAERCAVVKAVSEGYTNFRAIAVATDSEQYVSPCGGCRQVLSEFAKLSDYWVIMTRPGEHSIHTALDIYHVILDLTSLEETRCVCCFLFRLSLFRQQWRFAMPTLHSDLMERLVYLTGSAAAVVSRRSTLKQIVKTLNAAGLLAPEDGPLGRSGRDQGGVTSRREVSPRPTLNWMHEDKVEQDDSWVTSSPAYTKLQDGLIAILTSCLATIRHYCPPLGPMIMEGGVDLVEFTPLFALSLAPPTIQLTTPPSLATLTTCLSTGVDLLNKLDPPRAGTPSRSPIRSPSINRSPAALQKRAEYLRFLEQTVVVLLSQATRYLVDPDVPSHDKLQLKKELANELGNFTTDLLRNFTRKGAPSPVRTKLSVPSRGHAYPLQDSFSGKGSSLTFSDTSEQAIFKVADSFSKQFFR